MENSSVESVDKYLLVLIFLTIIAEAAGCAGFSIFAEEGVGEPPSKDPYQTPVKASFKLG